MARHMGGWVKIYRSLVNGDIGNNPFRFTIFSKLIGWANLEESWVEWGGKPRRCPRGSLVTSLRELAESMECSKATVSKQLGYLVLRQSVIVEKSPHGLFIEIPNYELYQGQDTEGHTQDECDVNASCTQSEREVTHNEERKNKRKKESSCPVVEKSTPVHVDSADELLSLFDEKRMKELHELYPDEDFLKREAIRAVQWYRENPKKLPKTTRGWKQAFSSWLAKGWRRHVTSIPGKPMRPKGIAEILADETIGGQK